jgi:2,4-diaminopentanoate dehydrogenase
VHGSSLNPGDLSGVLPLALSGMSRAIDKITLQERADWSVYESTGITFDNMAFGLPVEQISPTANDFLAFNSSIFTEQVWFLADALRTHFFSLASFTRPASMEEHVRSANVATAMQVLNAVPAVCGAAPGFATMASLPLVRSHTGFGHA